MFGRLLRARIYHFLLEIHPILSEIRVSILGEILVSWRHWRKTSWRNKCFSFQLSYETLFCGIHCVHYTKFHKKVNKQILWTYNFRNLIFPVTSNEVPYVNRGPFVAAMKGTWFLLKNTTDNSLTYIFGGFKESATTWLSQLDPNVKVVLSL